MAHCTSQSSTVGSEKAVQLSVSNSEGVRRDAVFEEIIYLWKGEWAA